jgi:hypothetical protein
MAHSESSGSFGQGLSSSQALLGKELLEALLDSSSEIIVANIILFEAELPAQAFPSGAWE